MVVLGFFSQIDVRFISNKKIYKGFLVIPALPKNLKKSLSGERIKEVSPPIKAVS